MGRPRNVVIDSYGPSELLGPHNLVGGSLQLYRMLVNFFASKGLIVQTVTPNGRAISPIAHHLFLIPEDKADALNYTMRGPSRFNRSNPDPSDENPTGLAPSNTTA
jgi:hypothetical protein